MSVSDYLALAIQSLLAVALLGMTIVGFGFLTLPALYLFQWRQRRRDLASSSPVCALSEADLPRVLVQLPVFNEPDVIAGLLDCVAALDWPSEKLSIQVLDDSSDHTTEVARDRIKQMQHAGLTVEHLCRDHRAGFKAEALAAGLAHNDAPFVAILDADFRPPRDWLRAVVPVLLADAHTGFVQSRCEFANAGTNWLTRAQGLLFDTHFVMEQAVRSRAGLLFQFNG